MSLSGFSMAAVNTPIAPACNKIETDLAYGSDRVTSRERERELYIDGFKQCLIFLCRKGLNVNKSGTHVVCVV
jgi:hypothetical protein